MVGEIFDCSIQIEQGWRQGNQARRIDCTWHRIQKKFQPQMNRIDTDGDEK
jgi:hypothetical protein